MIIARIDPNGVVHNAVDDRIGMYTRTVKLRELENRFEISASAAAA